MTRCGLILDFGGVVTSDFYGAMTAFCIREGLPPDALVHALLETSDGTQGLAALELGDISQREYEIVLGRLLGVADQGLIPRVLADLRPCELVLALADRVRRAGIPVAVLSNSWGRGAYDLYAGYLLNERFDAVVISHEVGLRKPDPAIYRLAAQRIDRLESACVFVDDSPHNLPPAEALGMTVVRFRDHVSSVANIETALDISAHF